MLARRKTFRCVPLFLLAILALPSFPQTGSVAGSMFVSGIGKGTVPLVGPWKFHTGDNPSWSSPALEDSAWPSISGDRPWGMQGHRQYSGFAWYRLHLTFPPASAGPVRLALLIPRVDDIYEAFWNGEKIGAYGKMPPFPIWYVSPSAQIAAIGSSQSGGVLAFRIWRRPLLSDDYGDLGGFASAPLIGSSEDIQAAGEALAYQWLRSNQFLFAENLIYGLVALLSFLLWLRNRGQWVLLWMMGFALMPVLLVLLLASHLRWPYIVTMGLAQPIDSILDISLWLLLLWLLHLNRNPFLLRLVKILAVTSFTITSIDGLCLAISWHPVWLVWAQSIDAVITAINITIEMLPLLLVSVAVFQRRQLDAASWLVAIFAFLDQMLVVVRSALRQGQRFTGWTIGDQLAAPLFSIQGNEISLGIISRLLLLVSIVAAVYISYLEERRHEMHMAIEFSKARELQRLLIPDTQPDTPGFEISTSYCPALEVGGDFFQLIPLGRDPDRSALVILGDVSGHGLRAALTVSYIVGILRVLAELFPEPGPLLTEANRRLCGRMQSGFATCIAVTAHQNGSCALSSAGHPPPFLNYRPLEVEGALPLGLDLNAHYAQTALQLKQGDHLALYTDGLLEARNRYGELYGFERLQKLFSSSPTATQAAEEAISFGQDDDVTVVTLTYVGAIPARVSATARKSESCPSSQSTIGAPSREPASLPNSELRRSLL